MKPLLIPAFLLAGAVAFGGPASAADPMPKFSGCGKQVKDNANDAADPIADPAPREVEIEGAFLNADGTPTFNLQIANLTGEVPPPATSISYTANYGGASDTINFVRAHLDFTGSVVYEYGHQEPLATSTRYARDGETTGAMFPGEHGIVQITIPPEVGGKPGTTLKGVEGEAQLGRTTFVPGAVSQSPSRGLSFSDDTVPLGTVAIGPCAAAPAGGAPTPPATTPTTKPASSDAGRLPVKLATRSIKRAKARKTVKVKLRASEPLTAVGVRLSKGSKAYGTGKLAKLAKSGTVKIKLKRAIKKGTYAFDVAGTDGQGRRRVASFKLKVK